MNKRFRANKFQMVRPIGTQFGIFFLIAMGILFSGSAAQASDIYVGQNSAGANNGADCADARTVSSLARVDWTAGNTIHLCGTITAGFSVQGSGTPGNVITVKWESGARISVASGQIINLNGAASYLLFDGGTACGPSTTCYSNEFASQTGYPAGITGIIEATANGSALANHNTSTEAFSDCSGCHDIEIRNLIVRNLYVHSSMSDSTSSADTGSFVFQCSSGGAACTGTISIHDSDIHDTGNAISLEHFSAATINIYNNEMYHNNWEIENSGNGARTLFVYGNHWHDAKNWDTTADTFHHNGIHNYMNTASDSLGFYVYNNRSDGDWGPCCATASFLFTEVAPPANYYVWNNIVIQSCNNNTEPANQSYTVNSGAGPKFYNNSFFGCASTSGNVDAADLYGTGLAWENNAVQGYGQYIHVGPGFTDTVFDYNVYGPIGISGNPPWQCASSGLISLLTFGAACGVDLHSLKVTLVSLTTGAPSAGSPLIGAGANLTSLCTGNLASLCSDINGVARPASGAWTVGAYTSVASGSLPAPPTGVTAIAN